MDIRQTGRVFCACVTGLTLTASATDGTLESVAGTSPDAPASWFAESSWVDGIIASGADGKATLPSGRRYVGIDSPVEIKEMLRDQKSISDVPIFVGSETLTVALGGSLQGVVFYNPVAFAGMPDVLYTEFRGPLSINSAKSLYYKGTVRLRRDLWADSPSAVIDNPWQLKRINPFGSYACTLQIPCGSDAVTGTWQTTKGSKFLTRTGEEHAIAVGTTVSGDGIPDGAYVVRNFPEAGVIELSQAATGTCESTVTFAAFSPQVYQSLDTLTTSDRTVAQNCVLYLNKSRAADGFRVEVATFSSGSVFNFTITSSDGYVPGTLVLHRTADYKEGSLVLGRCHIEFAETGDASAAGWTASPVTMSSAASEARLTVTNGISARIARLGNLCGSIVKDGSGTLTVSIPDADAFAAAGKGALAVEEGTFAIESAETGATLPFAAVSVAAGATLTLSGQTLDAETFSFESGARVSGTGRLVVPLSVDLTGLSVDSSIEIVRAIEDANLIDRGEYVTTLPAAGVPGVPVFWFDASDADSLTVDTTGKVTQWNDHRGAEHLYATTWSSNTGSTLVTNEQGLGVCVMTVNTSSSSASNRKGLRFARSGGNVSVSGLKVLFKVCSASAGGGVLIGFSDGGDFCRTAASSQPSRTSPLFYDSAKFAGQEVFFNGEPGDWTTGFPHGGGASSDIGSLSPVLVDMSFSTNVTSVDNFGYVGKNRSGTDMVCECIAYTNELTLTEILQVRRYLLEKWVQAHVTHDPAQGRQIATCAAEDVRVAAEKVAEVGELAGSLVKYGAGSLVVDDIASAAATLQVAEGSLTIRSSVVTTNDLPDGLAFHVDAEAADSLTLSGTKVQEWRDVRGDGYPVATLHYNNPSYAAQSDLGGLHAVSLGGFDSARSSWHGSDLRFDALSNAHTVVTLSKPTAVVDSSTLSGGYLIGYAVANGDPSSANYLYGLFRSAGNASNALLNNNYSGLATTGGGVRASLNGDAVSPFETGFTGGWDLVSVTSYQRIYANAFTSVGGQSGKGYYSYGGKSLAECLIFTNALTKAEVKRVESYLNRKWFGRETSGLRAQSVAALTVDAGADCTVEGNRPLTVGALSAVGRVTGDVTLAEGATLAVAVVNRVPVAPNVAGTLDISAGGTLVLSSRVKSGVYDLGAVTGTGAGWTVTGPETDGATLAVVNGRLTLTLRHGTTIIWR